MKRAKVKIEVVATDMGSPFIKSARDNQPDAETAQDKKVFKGIRWMLVLNPDNLANKKQSARQRLDNALELNKPLATAYYMKQELRVIWHQDSKYHASKLLTDWVTKADASGINIFKSFARTLTRLRHAILAYYDFDRISSAKIEGGNNKIKTIHKVAYGYRDLGFLKLKILSMHENRENAFAG